MTAQLIQRRPIIRVDPAEVRLTVTVPVLDTEKPPEVGKHVDLEMVVGTRGRTITVQGKVTVCDQLRAGPGPTKPLPQGPASTPYELTIATDGTWVDGAAKR